MKVVILESVFENGAPIHKKGEIKDLTGAALQFLTVRGWARELTSAEEKDLGGGDDKGAGGDQGNGKKGKKSEKAE